MRIGFIGLGIMGRPMAHNLINAGYELIVYDKFAPTDDFAAQGVRVAASGREVAADSDVVILMLPNSPHVLDVLTCEGGVLDGAHDGLIVVDMSSIAPAASQQAHSLAADKGVAFIDAPVSGGEPKAIDGTLAIMVGGDAGAFETVRPLLEVMGSSVTHVGPIGAGNVTKLANQVIVALNIAAVSEAFTLATKAGVDPEAVFEAIRGGLAGSTVMNAKVPMILNGDFAPGFRIELHIKDLQNALDTAHELHTPVPLTAGVMEILQSLVVAGEQKNDHSGIIRYYERLADIEVRRND
ncbi:2-hydroxy-3-oxopropionate reductase [Actinomyces mediterranea]|uniref:2-hydroxy-3-oxopropionate reductase n=1 Tax=Actinomyces mediterranea TaxID=1871028 RepID=UPI0009703C55|nr:2-hydroxy-3-oxopropionate reductase [Actinomyces mediterranea]